MEGKRRKLNPLIWIVGVVSVIAIVVGMISSVEAPTPFDFLNQFPVAERRVSKDGSLRIVVLKADMQSVWQEVRTHFSGKRTFSSSGLMNLNGQVTEYKSLGTDEGMIKVSNDLQFADDGFSAAFTTPSLKPGYCAVAFTRPKSILDKAMEWLQRLFNPPSKAPPSSGQRIMV